MNRDISALTDKEYDLVIIGGGMFAICAAWDAALRGLSVALVEKGDFCGGTSANSFKIVHGGIRYIQHGDIIRVRESCRERSALLRVAPHLVKPLPIVIPTYGHGKNGKALLAAGLLAYDFFTMDRNRCIRDPNRYIPRGRFFSRDEVLDLFPGLSPQGLTGGALFCDGQMYNPTRLAISFLRSAIAAGVEAANYVKAVDFLCSRGRIIGIEAQDQFTGDKFPVRGRVVLNATGPWAERLLEEQLGLGLNRKAVYSRDACFVVPRQLTHDYALAVQGCTRDPDAMVSRAARHLFIVPWRGYSLIGVWHVVYQDKPDRVSVKGDELQSFIDEVNWAYPRLNLKLNDVLMWNAGLVPFGENKPGAVHLSYGKRSIILDHAQQHNLEGLVTLIGIRYTMARGDAAKAIDLVAKKLNHQAPRPATDRIPVHGGQMDSFQQLIQHARRQSQFRSSDTVLQALLHNYGSEYGRVLQYAKENPSWIDTVGNSTVIKAEVIHAIREESALKLADVIFRRTDLATGQHPGKESLRICAQLMAAELGWSTDQIGKEIAEVEGIFPSLNACPVTRTVTVPSMDVVL